MKPILFNTEMVRAILEGRKTETRRLIKIDLGMLDTDKHDKNHLYLQDAYGDSHHLTYYAPYKPGDILYVRETWANTWTPDGHEGFIYKADGKPDPFPYWGNEKQCKHEVWIPSIHMPRKAARIFLKVTEVKVERVQDITEVAAIAEGIKRLFDHMSDAEFEQYRQNVKNTSGLEVGEKHRQSWLNYLWHGNVGITKKQIDSWPYQYSGYENAKDSFSSLWQSVYVNWQDNPWVWVIKFERVDKPCE